MRIIIVYSLAHLGMVPCNRVTNCKHRHTHPNTQHSTVKHIDKRLYNYE